MVNERTLDIVKFTDEKHKKHLEKVRKLRERLAEKEEFVKKEEQEHAKKEERVKVLLRNFAESQEEDLSGEGNVCFMDDGSMKGTITKKDGSVIKFIKRKNESMKILERFDKNGKKIERKETWRQMFRRLNPFSERYEGENWKEYFENIKKRESK